MSRSVFMLVAVLAVAASCPALAAGPDLGAVPVAKPDTSRFLPRWLHASLEAGVSWMQAPREVSDRYTAGVVFGGGLTATAAARMRVSIRVAYLDLPTGENGYYSGYQTVGGQVYTTAYGSAGATRGGHAIEGLGQLSLRAWRSLWVEAGAGHGYFASGYPNVQFIDGLTGQYVDIPGKSGWGPAYTAGVAYEFTVRKREHLAVYGRWSRLERGGVALDFVPLGIGYRFD